MEENNDWRLDAYTDDLDGETFTLKRFVPNGDNDHEHCYFCWKKITDLHIENEDCDFEGYVCFSPKFKQEIWVCKECFNVFKEKFKFQER